MKRIIRHIRVWFLWHVQGCPTDRAVIIKRGKADGLSVSGWDIDLRYAHDVNGVELCADGNVLIGGYRREELVSL